VDGLADCGDGLVPPLGSVERRLAVMADPTTGAFGVAVVVAVLLLRTTALAATPVDVLLLGALWCTSRSVVAAGAVLLPYARPEGLASDFLGDRAPVLVASGAGVALALALGVVADGLQGVVAVAAVVAGAAVVLAFARQRVGGFTGDVLGATIVVGETVGLLAAAAR
jgi:adenosylcobinamide-GDP ribazoletransferase